MRANYKLQWMSLNDAKINYTESVATGNPKMALFNFACKMLVTAGTLFGSLTCETIIKNIKGGGANREHYWIEYPGGEVLSIMKSLN